MVNIEITGAKELVPVYAKDGDAGADLRSSEGGYIPARGSALIKTGIKLAIPAGYVGLVHPRSGLALKQGLTVLNTPSTIDSGYRGEVGVILYNTTDIDVYIQPGDRIAQLVIQKFERAEFKIVDVLSDTSRGDGGFGSSGVS
jgi:dUTP pyrophosphatase